MSQSHSDLYAKVKGSSNHQVLVRVATGQEPGFKEKKGRYNCTGKFQYRVFVEDGKVRNVPTAEEINKIEQEFPGTVVDLEAIQGRKLSEHPIQDAYSYRLANIYLGAENEKELLEKYHRIIDKLNIKIE